MGIWHHQPECNIRQHEINKCNIRQQSQQEIASPRKNEMKIITVQQCARMVLRELSVGKFWTVPINMFVAI